MADIEAASPLRRRWYGRPVQKAATAGRLVAAETNNSVPQRAA